MFKVTIEVAEDCQCDDQLNHKVECDVHMDWMDKGTKHKVTLRPTVIGPNGHLMYDVLSDSRLNIFNLLVDFCSGDIDQALYELEDMVDMTRPSEPPPTTLNTLERMHQHCMEMESDCDELRVMGDMDDELYSLQADVESLTSDIQDLIEDKQ